MNLQNAKIYHDGSHFIAIPQGAYPSGKGCKRRVAKTMQQLSLTSESPPETPKERFEKAYKESLSLPKRFAKNTVYNILKNERYSGIYRHNGEIFDNIYPLIVPAETFEKVRAKVFKNKYGKASIVMDYILKDKITCGYCGQSIIGENGTANNGERKYYYKCRGRKAKINDCKKATVRKEVLENIVIDTIVNELKKPPMMDFIVGGLMEEQKRQAEQNTALNILTREKRQTENSINNIMQAVEQGGATATAMKRMRELEARITELEQKIIIEKSKTAVMLTEKQIRDYYESALRCEPKMLINLLIKQIILFDDKIQIILTRPIQRSPENNRGFSFYSKKIEISYRVPYRVNTVRIEFEIEMRLLPQCKFRGFNARKRTVLRN